MKSWPQKGPAVDLRRSRKGAWIEMLLLDYMERVVPRRSRKGAWIEISESVGRVANFWSLPQGSVD